MILMLFISLAWAGPSLDPIADPRYRFCQTAEAPLADIQPWCKALDALPPGRCPGLRESCSSKTEAKAGLGCDASVPGMPAGGLQGGVALGVFLGLTAFAFWLFRRPRVAVVSVAGTVPPVARGDDPPRRDELPDAERELESGRYREAIERARDAAWAHLVATGRIEGLRSMTDREVSAAIGTAGACAALWSEIRLGREKPRWSHGIVDEKAARRVLHAAIRLIQLGALVALLPGRAAWAGRESPHGEQAWFDAFSAAGFEVAWATAPVKSERIDPAVDVMIWDAERRSEGPGLRAWVEAGGVLLALGDAAGVFPELGAFRVTEDFPRATTFFPADLPFPRWPSGVRGAYDDATGEVWVEAANAELRPAAVIQVVRLGDGAVLACTDRRMLSNIAFVWPENVSFFLGALAAAEDRGSFCLPRDTAQMVFATRPNSASGEPLQALGASGLSPLVAQLLALGVVLIWWKGWRFQRVPDTLGAAQRSFAEHAVALGRRYAERGATRFVYAKSAKYALERYGSRTLTQRALRMGYATGAAEALVRRWQDVAAAPNGPNRPQDRSDMEEMWRILGP